MSKPKNPAPIYQYAKSMANESIKSDPSISKVLWFPHEKQIRLVEVTDLSIASDDNKVHPYYFSPVADVPHVSAIALIRSNEEGRLRLPPGWGNWDDAKILIHKSSRRKPARASGTSA